MKKLMAVVTVAAVVAVASVALASTSEQVVDEARVQAQIDGRLHELMVKMRLHRGR